MARRDPAIASRTGLEAAASTAAPAEILRGLLDAWRDDHHPAIAELVDAAVRRALAHRPARALTGTVAERHARWLAVARERDPLDLDWLLAHLVPPRIELALERIAELATWPDDPRIVVGLVRLCRTKPLVTHRPLWTQIFRAIRKRLAAHVVPLMTELSALSAVTSFDEYMRNRLATLIGASAALPVPHEPDAALVARIASALDVHGDRASKRTLDDLLREVWAAPSDDGPRHVLADWLTERNDPRGELIALQLARARRPGDAAATRRERALLDQNGRAWMGPLEPVVVPSAFVAFERGFVSRCEVAWRRLGAMPQLMTHPAWSTVREYRLASEGERLCDTWLDHMVALGAKRL
ncbi:MAG TPA: TIGR02996 domain-containing protein [Kofleriaceae bacterium]|jgi:uncharacterized protein (TIGR02996 family)